MSNELLAAQVWAVAWLLAPEGTPADTFAKWVAIVWLVIGLITTLAPHEKS